jgi:hypothetical protein
VEALASEAFGITIPLFEGSDTVQAITIPLFTGAIGYLTNWSGVWMLFNPVRFAGFRVRGLVALVSLLPRRIQQIPGVMQGGVGWQGIIPSRAARMGSIAVDKGIAKLGSPADFYRQLQPDKIAEHILATSRGEIRELVERILEREHPQLWRETPPRVREAVHARVQEQLPGIVRTVTAEIGAHIDQLLDVKLMVIARLEERPELANRIFLEVGRRELRFMINFGFFFRPLARDTARLPDRGRASLVGPADRRRGDRIRDQLGRAVDDLRAPGAAEAGAVHAPRPLHAALAGGLARVFGDHRRGHRHPAQHRLPAPPWPELRPHSANDRGGPGTRRGSCRRPRAGAHGRPGGRRVPRVRRDP